MKKPKWFIFLTGLYIESELFLKKFGLLFALLSLALFAQISLTFSKFVTEQKLCRDGARTENLGGRGPRKNVGEIICPPWLR